MTALITIASILFFGNKALLLLNKKINQKLGWFFGFLGAILFVIYFFLINTPILSIMEIGLTVLMFYRFIVGDKSNKAVEKFLGIVTGLIIISLTILTNEGLMTGAQFFGAFGMLLGTYFLISVEQSQFEKTNWQERVGWLLYALGHVFTSYIGYQKQEWIFFVFQAWQMFLCLCGFLFINQRQRKKITVTVLVGGAAVAALFLIVIN